MTQTTQFTKAQTDLADAIEDQVSPTLAKWVRQQFDMGRTVDDVKAQFNRAIATIESSTTA